MRSGLAVLALLLLAACGAGREEPCGAGPPSGAGLVRFEDAEVGLGGEHPAAWHRARALTELALPREVLAVASFPLRQERQLGGCAPKRFLAGMPADGAFVWLLEYRPGRGDPWAELSRDRFPPRPRFELDRSQLDRGLYCYPGPAYTTTFRAADRPFQLFAAFGEEAGEARLAEASAILNGLWFDELPPPPPDPHAGWPLVHDNPGDSFRPPPGWAAAAAMFPPGETPRPRPLFFTSNRPLPGLPPRLVPHVDELPGPWPSQALAGLPRDAVLLWILEEASGEASEHFPAIGRDWPAGALRPAPAPTAAAPEVAWLRAGGAFRGYRFSVWIASGPAAAAEDVELARESAASLAVSGCGREGREDCPEP